MKFSLKTALISAALFLLLWAASLAFAQGSLRQVIANDPDLSIFNSALEVADPRIAEALEVDAGLTVIAPNDDAFAALARFIEVPLDDLLEDADLLSLILSYHVLIGRYTEEQLQASVGALLPTRMEGAFVSVAVQNNGRPIFNNVGEVLRADISASNGLLHVIDDGLLNRVINQAVEARVQGGSSTISSAADNGVTLSLGRNNPYAAPVRPCPDTPYLRFAHWASGSPSMAVYVNGAESSERILDGFEAGQFSLPVTLPTNNVNVTVAPVGVDPSNSPLTLDILIGESCIQTLVLVGTTGGLRLAQVNESAGTPEAGSSRVTVVNTISSDVGFSLSGEVLVGELGRGESATFDVPYGVYQPAFAFTTGEPIAMNRLSLWDQSRYLIVLTGTDSAPLVGATSLSKAEAERLFIAR